jgi:broad specificity polyphosphatase/5'/3'-nucleotidase SurE
MPYGATLNVNYPEKYISKKIVCTHMTTKMIEDSCEYEVNPFGNTFYWYKPSVTGFAQSALEQKGDLYWLNKNYITVTPLKFDLTCDNSLDIIRKGGISL